MQISFARIANIVSLGFTPFIMTLTECAIQIVFNINLNRATGGNKDYTAALTVMLSALPVSYTHLYKRREGYFKASYT